MLKRSVWSAAAILDVNVRLNNAQVCTCAVVSPKTYPTQVCHDYLVSSDSPVGLKISFVQNVGRNIIRHSPITWNTHRVLQCVLMVRTK